MDEEASTLGTIAAIMIDWTNTYITPKTDDWFRSHPEEEQHKEEYALTYSTRSDFLSRHPRHKPHIKRTGFPVRSSKPDGKTIHFYFYREHLHPRFQAVEEQVNPIHETREGYLIRDNEQFFFVTRGGEIHPLRHPQYESAEKLLRKHNPKHLSPTPLRRETRDRVLKILAAAHPEYVVPLKVKP